MTHHHTAALLALLLHGCGCWDEEGNPLPEGSCFVSTETGATTDTAVPTDTGTTDDTGSTDDTGTGSFDPIEAPDGDFLVASVNGPILLCTLAEVGAVCAPWDDHPDWDWNGEALALGDKWLFAAGKAVWWQYTSQGWSKAWDGFAPWPLDVAIHEDTTVVWTWDGVYTRIGLSDDWREQSTLKPPAAIPFRGNLLHADGVFAVGSDSGVSFSTDGLVWSNPKPAANAIAFHDGTWVALGRDGAAWYSTDREDWSFVELPGQAPITVEDVTWCGDRFLAVGRQVVYESLDGTSWLDITPDGDPSYEALACHEATGAALVVGFGTASLYRNGDFEAVSFPTLANDMAHVIGLP